MAVKSHILGPGSLKIGAAASAVEFAAGVRQITLTPTTESGDTLPVLSGDEFSSAATTTWSLNVTLLQEYSAASLALWAFNQQGQTLPFTFKPDNDKVQVWTGDVTVQPVAIGGEVKTRAESEFEWVARNIKVTNGTTAAALTYAAETPANTSPTGIETRPDWF